MEPTTNYIPEQLTQERKEEIEQAAIERYRQERKNKMIAFCNQTWVIVLASVICSLLAYSLLSNLAFDLHHARMPFGMPHGINPFF